MLLSLNNPAPSDFIKNFVAQNEVNCDRIDAYAGPYGIQTYTPALTSSGTNPTLGTGGFINGSYYTIFDQVFTWGEFKFKTGFSQGSGTFEISIPFPAQTSVAPSTGSGGGLIVGAGRVWDNSASTARQPVIAQLRTSLKIMFSVRADTGGGGRACGSNIPFTWDVDDGISWFVRYQRQAS